MSRECPDCLASEDKCGCHLDEADIIEKLQAENARLKEELDLRNQIILTETKAAERRGFEGGWYKGRANKGKCLCDGSCYDDFIAEDFKKWEAENNAK